MAAEPKSKRRRLVLAIAGALLAPAGPAAAQRANRTSRVGVLFAAGLEGYYAAFRAELRQLGYVEGRNLQLDARWAEGDLTRLPQLAAELLALKPDVIVASSTPSIVALKRATTTVPIVMATSADSVRSGFVATLSRPGANITGNSAMNFDLSLKTIHLLHACVPQVTRIGLLLTRNSAYNPQLDEIVAGARAFGVTVVPLRANTEAEIESVFNGAAQEKLGGMAVFGDSVFVAHKRKLAEKAAAMRLPTIYQWRSHVDAGGLMSYGPDINSLWRMAARCVDRILKGANPAELPVQQPTVFELFINGTVAKNLGITIPPDVLLRADAVIE